MVSRSRLLVIFKERSEQFPEPAKSASLGLKHWARVSRRDYAQADARNTVWFHADALRELSPEQADGIVIHELGHLADPRVDEPGAEARADRLAERYTGQRVWYDDRMIQTTAGGTDRPRSLHK